MKRILLRFSMLAVLAAAAGFLYIDTPVSAAGDCGMTVINKWMSCDNAYATTVQSYTIRERHCEQTAPAACPDEPTHQNCLNNSSDYAACCLSASRASCENTITTSYGNRGSSYFSCLGIEGNYGNCVEQVADFCVGAHGRYQDCALMYDGEEHIEARMTCIANSGIDQCV